MELQQMLGGRYKLLNELGSGGMAVVWRARDEVLGRPVAVKVLAGRFAGDPRSRARIRDEARHAATLSHPNIAQVYDYGESAEGDAPLPYVVMELINGPTLQQRVAGGPLPPRTVFRICGEVAAALAAAHADGLVHRDIKMANIMVTAAGAKVVDFGIAAAIGPGAPEEMVVGTPAYLAPERLTGAANEPASDVYALGVLLYRLLAHQAPWSVETTTQMLDAHIYLEPEPLPPLPGVPQAVADLVLRCLRKNPAARPSAAEVSATLGDAAEAATLQTPDPVRAESPPRSQRVPRAAAGDFNELTSASAKRHTAKPDDRRAADAPRTASDPHTASGHCGPGDHREAGAAATGLAAGLGRAGPGLAGPGSAGPGLAGPGSAGPGSAGPGSAGPGKSDGGSVAKPRTSGHAADAGKSRGSAEAEPGWWAGAAGPAKSRNTTDAEPASSAGTARPAKDRSTAEAGLRASGNATAPADNRCTTQPEPRGRGSATAPTNNQGTTQPEPRGHRNSAAPSGRSTSQAEPRGEEDAAGPTDNRRIALPEPRGSADAAGPRGVAEGGSGIGQDAAEREKERRRGRAIPSGIGTDVSGRRNDEKDRPHAAATPSDLGTDNGEHRNDDQGRRHAAATPSDIGTDNGEHRNDDQGRRHAAATPSDTETDNGERRNDDQGRRHAAATPSDTGTDIGERRNDDQGRRHAAAAPSWVGAGVGARAGGEKGPANGTAVALAGLGGGRVGARRLGSAVGAGRGGAVGDGSAPVRQGKRKALLAGGGVAAALIVGLALWGFAGGGGKGDADRGVVGVASVAPTAGSVSEAPSLSGDGSGAVPAATDVGGRPPGAGSGTAPSAGSSGSASAAPAGPIGGTARPSASASPTASKAPEGTRLTSPGGVVYAVCDQGKATLTGWEPAAGYAVQKVVAGPALTAEIVFRSPSSRYRMTVTCFAGSPTPVVLPL